MSRLDRLRITPRRTMIAVIVVALLLELVLWRRRHDYCRDNADRCASAERIHLWMAGSHERTSARYRRRAAEAEAGLLFHNEQAVLYTKATRDERAKARGAADRGEGFRLAARFPWVSIPPEWTETIGSVPAEREEFSERPLHSPPDRAIDTEPARPRRFTGGT
jgi:hypothetical protein